MSEGEVGINRRGLVASLAAIISSPPTRGVDIRGCADMLARALAAEHGGCWRIHIDDDGLVVMMIKESSERT